MSETAGASHRERWVTMSSFSCDRDARADDENLPHRLVDLGAPSLDPIARFDIAQLTRALLVEANFQSFASLRRLGDKDARSQSFSNTNCFRADYGSLPFKILSSANLVLGVSSQYLIDIYTYFIVYRWHSWISHSCWLISLRCDHTWLWLPSFLCIVSPCH